MITAYRLKKLKACKPKVDLFRKLFPNGAPMTVEAAVSVADKFNWGWAAYHLLTHEGRKAYDDVHAALFARIYIEENQPCP